jgi:hypothetical protein
MSGCVDNCMTASSQNSQQTWTSWADCGCTSCSSQCADTCK